MSGANASHHRRIDETAPNADHNHLRQQAAPFLCPSISFGWLERWPSIPEMVTGRFPAAFGEADQCAARMVALPRKDSNGGDQ
jgi:hypothetical protein